MSRRGRVPESLYQFATERSTGPTRGIDFPTATLVPPNIPNAGVAQDWSARGARPDYMGQSRLTGIVSGLLSRKRDEARRRERVARARASASGGTSPSSGGSTPPSGGGGTPPSGGGTPPSGGGTPPSGGGTPPTASTGTPVTVRRRTSPAASGASATPAGSSPLPPVPPFQGTPYLPPSMRPNAARQRRAPASQPGTTPPMGNFSGMGSGLARPQVAPVPTYSNRAANPNYQIPFSPAAAVPNAAANEPEGDVPRVPFSRLMPNPPHVPYSLRMKRKAPTPTSPLPAYTPDPRWNPNIPTLPLAPSPEAGEAARKKLGLPSFAEIVSGEYPGSQGPNVSVPKGNLGSIVGSTTEAPQPVKKATRKRTPAAKKDAAPKSPRTKKPKP